MDMQLIAWLAAALVCLSFFMKTIVPLRTLAIAGNVAFIAYALAGIGDGVFDKVLPILVLHLTLLPVNIFRLHQVKQTIRRVRQVASEEHSMDFLIPYMKHEQANQGRVLFNKGDAADRVYLLVSGSVNLVELGKTLGAGEVFGEVGVFADHARRISSAVCAEECDLFSITGDKVIELFYQDPRFGFFIVRALSKYVSEGVQQPAAGLPLVVPAATR